MRQYFKYSVLVIIYRKQLISEKQAQAKRYKGFIDKLNFEKISVPMNTKEYIDKFERWNEKYVITIFQGSRRMTRRNSL